MLSVRYFLPFAKYVMLTCETWAVPDPGKPGHCPGKILVNCAYCLPRTILSCGMMGQSRQTVRTTDQYKARRLGGGTRFFSTHKLTVRAARVASPGNPATLKPPLNIL